VFLALSADGGGGGEGARRNQVDVVSHENIGTKNVVCPLFLQQVLHGEVCYYKRKPCNE